MLQGYEVELYDTYIYLNKGDNYGTDKVHICTYSDVERFESVTHLKPLKFDTDKNCGNLWERYKHLNLLDASLAAGFDFIQLAQYEYTAMQGDESGCISLEPWESDTLAEWLQYLYDIYDIMNY